MAASERACFREVVEEVLAHLLVTAIREWRRGTPAMARRRSSTDSVGLGFGFADETEREREGKVRARCEELVLVLIHAQQRPGRTGRAGAAPAMARCRYRRRRRRPGDGFAQNPLDVLFFFCSGPFSILISVLLFKTCSKVFN